MRTIALTIGLFFSLFNVQAQFDITTEHLPITDDVYTYLHQADVSFDISVGGTDQTWDFSALSAESIDFNYVDPVSLSNGMEFPEASLGETQSGSDVQNFYLVNESGMAVVGQTTSAGAISYSTPRLVIPTPFAFGDMSSSSFEGMVEASGSTFERAGDIDITGFGTGTLIAPYGEIEDVLCLKSIAIYDDYLNGFSVTDYVETSYLFFTEDASTFIGSYVTLTVFGSPAGSYIDLISEDGLTSMLELSAADISLYPNPSRGMILLEGVDKLDLATVYDINGRALRSISINSDRRNIDLTDLEAGTYIMTLQNRNGVLSKRFVLE